MPTNESEIMENLTIHDRKQQFEIPLESTDRVNDQLQLNDPLQTIVRSARTKDTLSDRLKTYTDASVSSSSWLSTRTIPKDEEIDLELEKAKKVFNVTSLSGSQRTKRGKKFKDKAIQQAGMINLMNQCNWQREEALNDLLNHGKLKENDEFLQKTGSDIDTISVKMKDLAFYYEQKRITDTSVKTVDKSLYSPLEKLADPEMRLEGYRDVLGELEKLDLKSFEYKDNASFMQSKGKNSFLKRYSALKAFSNVQGMIDALGREELGLKRYMMLSAKSAVLKEILEDYENRAILLQSPYYVLFAEKDLDSLSDDDIRERIGKTEDILAKNYMERILDRRSKKLFKKGSSTSDVFKKTLKEGTWVKDADEIRKKTWKKIMVPYDKNMEDSNADRGLNTKYYNDHAAKLKKRLELHSLPFKQWHGLPLTDKEKELLDEFNKEKQEQPSLLLDEWVANRISQIEEEAAKMESEHDLAFIKGPAMFSITKTYTNAKITPKPEIYDRRKDASAATLVKHLEEYSDSGSFKEKTVNEDVDNLVNNIRLDNMVKDGKLDFSFVDKDLLDMIKAIELSYAFFDDIMLVMKQDISLCDQKLENAKKLLEAKPELKANWTDELQRLTDMKNDAELTYKEFDKLSLKYRSKNGAVLEAFVACRDISCIRSAKDLLEGEKKGTYRDAMIKNLDLREQQLQKDLDYIREKIFNDVRTTDGAIDKFTGQQQKLLKQQTKAYNMILELDKTGAKGQKKVLELMKEIRESLYNYSDAEYRAFLGF